MRSTVVALDIGGANLKAVCSQGGVVSRPFALWKNHTHLTNELRKLRRQLPVFDVVALTMTGELCDCFATKRDGVHFILDSVECVFRPKPIGVWQTDGKVLGVVDAKKCAVKTAASNWH